MILRRFMGHVKDQNWFAVGLDVLVVITGIFLGMQVTDWNETRKQAAREQGTLVSIGNDLRISADLVEERLQQEREANAAVERLLAFGESDNSASSEEIGRDLNVSLYAIYDMQYQQITFKELENSGNISLISSRELRAMLQALDLRFIDTATNELDLYDFIKNEVDPWFLENTDVHEHVRYDVDVQTGVLADLLSAPQHTGALRTTIQDRTVKNFLWYRYSMGQGNLRRMEPFLEDIKTAQALVMELSDQYE